MQDIDRPAHIQTLPKPARTRRACIETEPLRVVSRSNDLNRIISDCCGKRDLGQEPSVRTTEPQRAIGLSIDPVALLVHRAVVSATEQCEIRERCGATVGPVAHVMPFTQRQSAAREPASAVSMVKRAPQRRRNRPRPGSHFHDPALFVVSHHHATRVAPQPPRRFSWNARAILEDWLARPIRLREDWRVDMDHHLVPLARGARIQLVV
jgi:hypothetical protein